MKRCTPLAAVLALFLTAAAFAPCQGAVIINAIEDSGNVVFTFSGSINLTGLTYEGSGGAYIFPIIRPTYPTVMIGSGFADVYSPSITGSLVFGTGGDPSPDFVSGDRFGFDGSTRLLFAEGYVSNSALSGSMTFNNTDFITLGLTKGSYLGTLGNADTITMNIGSVPEPSRVLLAGLGICGLLMRRRRRNRLA